MKQDLKGQRDIEDLLACKVFQDLMVLLETKVHLDLQALQDQVENLVRKDLQVEMVE